MAMGFENSRRCASMLRRRCQADSDFRVENEKQGVFSAFVRRAPARLTGLLRLLAKLTVLCVQSMSAMRLVSAAHDPMSLTAW